jgi:serine/threonine protein kinase
VRYLLPLVRDALAGRYVVDQEIACGGAARIFAGRSPRGDAVAIKILHPELSVTVTADRFVREMEVLRRLDHPGVARVTDSGECGPFVYYVMPFIPGPNLRQHLDQVRRASVSDTRRIGRDLLGALSYAHAHGIVHRDVKPDNVILSPEGPVLVDFGIAKAIEQAGNQRLTRSGFTVGTSTYMSPEQARGDRDIDRRTDIYSLGCVLFECLAGRPPFQHPREEMMLHMLQVEDAPDVRTFRDDAPADLAAAISRSLEKERSKRWQTAGEMLGGLGS